MCKYVLLEYNTQVQTVILSQKSGYLYVHCVSRGSHQPAGSSLSQLAKSDSGKRTFLKQRVEIALIICDTANISPQS